MKQIPTLAWARMVGHKRLKDGLNEGRYVGMYHDGRARIRMSGWVGHNIETAPEMLWPADQVAVLDEPAKGKGKGMRLEKMQGSREKAMAGNGTGKRKRKGAAA